MFYCESDKGIINIITNMYLDSKEGNITKIKYDDISLEERNLALDFISAIVKTKNPMSLHDVNLEKDYYSSITMNEINQVNKYIDFYRSETHKKEFKSDFNRILKHYPKIINNTNTKTNFTYINDRDSVLYLSDIDMLDKDLDLTFRSNIFTVEELSKLYSLTVRLILPKYMIDKIQCRHMISFLHKTTSGDIVFSPQKSSIKVMNEINSYFEYIQQHYDSGNRISYDMLPSCTMFRVYINATFNEWSNIINNLAPLENEYIGQTIGNVYYSLINYKNINKLFCIDKQVETGIVARLYARRGN